MAAASMSVSDRLVARRAHLQQFCFVEPVKQHLRLVSYYQLARQVYRQTEVYFSDCAWDNAYVLIAKFIKLCSKVIPSHRDYEKPAYAKEREWISEQTHLAIPLFEAILDGMEDEEREYMEYELERERDAQRRDRRPRSADKGKTSNDKLESRLASLRLKNASSSEPPTTTSRPKEAATKLSSSFSGSKSRRAPRTPSPSNRTTGNVLYPSVGKASWMQVEQIDKSPGTSTVSTNTEREQRVPISRRKSLEALELLSSGKNRLLEIPTTIIAQFTDIAAPNTNRFPDGIETCGILAGVLQGVRLIITTLIIPKQEGSSNMCTMNNEEELFDYCFSHDLLTLGWIHTHPRQTCFLSSVDVHTQCGFQSILPEAVAIVVAPTDRVQNVGVFRLNEPDGLQLIQNCNLAGFHAHPDNVEIYSNALECQWDRSSTPMVVDMR